MKNRIFAYFQALSHKMLTNDKALKGPLWWRSLASATNHIIPVNITSSETHGGHMGSLIGCAQCHFCGSSAKSNNRNTSACNLPKCPGLERQRKTENRSRQKETKTKKM